VRHPVTPQTNSLRNHYLPLDHIPQTGLQSATVSTAVNAAFHFIGLWVVEATITSHPGEDL